MKGYQNLSAEEKNDFILNKEKTFIIYTYIYIYIYIYIIYYILYYIIYIYINRA